MIIDTLPYCGPWLLRPVPVAEMGARAAKLNDGVHKVLQ